MREAVESLWPELAWISDPELKEQVTKTWILAFERSPLDPEDLNRIPFTLLIPGCPATFMEHKRCVVHIARRSAEAMDEFLGRALPIDMDVVIAGAILADVGKVLEYEKVDGVAVQSARGQALRHPFTGRGRGHGMWSPGRRLPHHRHPCRRRKPGQPIHRSLDRAPRRLHELRAVQDPREMNSFNLPRSWNSNATD